MEIESAKCDCCGLKEDCTHHYILQVKSQFDGKWLCGLCSEAVRDELLSRSPSAMGDAVKAHMSFCRKYNKSNPAIRVADGMRQMLRRRSGNLEEKNKYSRSASVSSSSSSQAGDGSRLPSSPYSC